MTASWTGGRIGRQLRRAGGRVALAAAALGVAATAALPGRVAGQDPGGFPGVSLGLLYESGTYRPPIAFKPFQGRLGGQAVSSQVEAIMTRDLRYSDRYVVMDSVPGAFLTGDQIDYALWDRLGAVWLVTGQVEGVGGEFDLVVQLHDVVYRQVHQEGRFRLPVATHPDFRMSVHRASDEIVRWTFDEPGVAATRVAFSMLQNGVKELYLIDSDGENLQRVTGHGDVVLSPTWAPDGRRIAYSSPHESGNWEIFELDLGTRRSRKIDAATGGAYITPAYDPDGETLAFAVQGGSRRGIYTYNLARDCCLTRVTEGTRDDLSPTFSPDGRFVAFNSNRLGDAVPQIFVVPRSGGNASLVSPYVFGQQGYYTSPDWSPIGDFVAFHGRVSRSGPFHILVARMGQQGRLTQLTNEGQNEDPSWAPDGRHLVFRGERAWGKGLFIVDTVTGTLRTLLAGVEANVPQWSPALAPAATGGSATP